MEDEPDSVREHPNYMARYQKAVPLTQKRLKVWYPNIIENVYVTIQMQLMRGIVSRPA